MDHFDRSTKFFSDLYAAISDTSAKPFSPCNIHLLCHFDFVKLIIGAYI